MRSPSALDLLALRRRGPAALLLAVLLVGCGSSDSNGAAGSESPKPTANLSASDGAPTRSTVYLLSDERTVPLGVRRDLTRRPGVSTSRLALAKLLAGPTAGERHRGLETAIPAEAEVRSLTIDIKAQGSEAFVDLGGLPLADDADALLKVRVMTQVARTLIGLNDIERVWLRADGRPWGLWDMQGKIRDDPIDYDRLRGFSHICAAKPGTEAVLGDCFSALP